MLSRCFVLSVLVLFVVPAIHAAANPPPPVPTLDGPQFSELLKTDEQVVVGIVQKGQCGEPCAKLEEFLSALMVKMKGFWKACVVDVRTAVDVGGGDEMTIHSMFNISTIPLVMIYRYGIKNVKSPMMLQQEAIGQMIGGYSMAQHQKQIHDVFLQFLPTRVERVNAGNLKEWFQKDPNKATVLLVTSKKVTPPMFTKLSLDYGAGVSFGELRSSDAGAVEELAKLGGPKIDKFPKLLMGKALKEGWAAPTDVYSGALGLGPIGEAVAKINPGIPIPEMINQDALDKACISKGGICLIAVLPARFEKPLEHFKGVASRWLGDSAALANFVWLNEEKQERFVETFKVEYFPGLVAVNVRKKLYSSFVGNFDTETLYSFVTRVLSGKEALTRFDSLPKLEKASPTLPMAGLDALLGKKEL